MGLGSQNQTRRGAGTHEVEASNWDNFLRGNPRGQYQQSSRWAWVKAGEGWDARVETWGESGEIAGGFQLLIRSTRWGRIGFINKGPVLAQETPKAIQEALRSVVQFARSERLRALILQPPDLSRIQQEDLERVGFCRGAVPGIIDATLIVSLEGGPESIRARMGRTSRREVRQAIERGVQIVEGARSDLPRFFELMCHTCRRQGVAPNPGTVEALYWRWDAFGPDIRLLFATVRGEAVAGLLLHKFGSRCSFEKKGWSEAHPEAHPNTLLHVEAMYHAAAWGCNNVDFCAMDRPLAERMLRGENVEQELAETRHAFNIRLGARPMLLPSAQVCVFKPWQKWLLNWCLGKPGMAWRMIRKITM